MRIRLRVIHTPVGIMYQVSGQNSQPYEVKIMRGCVSFEIKDQILTIYMDLLTGHQRTFLQFIATTCLTTLVSLRVQGVFEIFFTLFVDLKAGGGEEQILPSFSMDAEHRSFKQRVKKKKERVEPKHKLKEEKLANVFFVIFRLFSTQLNCNGSQYLSQPEIKDNIKKCCQKILKILLSSSNKGCLLASLVHAPPSFSKVQQIFWPEAKRKIHKIKQSPQIRESKTSLIKHFCPFSRKGYGKRSFCMFEEDLSLRRTKL